MSFITFLTVFLIASTFAEEFQKECPSNIKAVENFDLKKYLGKWFEIKKYNQSFKDHKECVHYELLQENDGSIRFLKSILNRKNVETNFISLSFPNESPVSGKLSVSSTKEFSKSNYWILDTDYLNYAIAYDCEDDLEKHSSEVVVWILSRTPSLSEESQKKVDDFVEQFFDNKLFITTKQDKEL